MLQRGALSAEEVLERVKAAHEDERALIQGLTDPQARAASNLPGWTRGHILGARLAFLRAANRQSACALEGRLEDFYEGGRSGRDAEIDAHAGRPADDLVSAMGCATGALEAGWRQMTTSDWSRPVAYRRGSTLMDVLLASWREAEIHRIDLGLGVRPSAWSADLCIHLFEFLGARVPKTMQIELTSPEGATWTLGEGERIVIEGASTDLAAWLAGRPPEAPLRSSTGALPELGRLRDAGG